MTAAGSRSDMNTLSVRPQPRRRPASSAHLLGHHQVVPKAITYLFEPKSTMHLCAGQFWAVPLPDGRFGCGRVLHVPGPSDPESSLYLSTRISSPGLMNWSGDEPPTAETIAGSKLLDQGRVRVAAITDTGGKTLGQRDLELEARAALQPGRATGAAGPRPGSAPGTARRTRLGIDAGPVRHTTWTPGWPRSHTPRHRRFGPGGRQPGPRSRHRSGRLRRPGRGTARSHQRRAPLGTLTSGSGSRSNGRSAICRESGTPGAASSTAPARPVNQLIPVRHILDDQGRQPGGPAAHRSSELARGQVTTVAREHPESPLQPLIDGRGSRVTAHPAVETIK